MTVRRVLVALGAALVLALTACSSPDHTDADVAFARQMIPHHQQAVEMSDLAATRAADPEVRALATTIRGEQSPEIDRMTGFLARWEAPPPDGTMDASMPGMVDTTTLASTSGATFDRLWVQGMIGHHRGALEMADRELAAGTDPEARALARSITDGQSREIAQMQAIGTRLG